MTTESDKLVREGNAAAERGDHTEAARLFALAVSAGAVWASINLGNSYQALGDFDAAERAFAAGWGAGDDDAGFNLALAHQSRGRVSEARKIFRDLVQTGYVKAMDQEAWFLREEGNKSGAIELMSLAAAAPGPDGDRAAGILGTWLWEGSKDPSAEVLLHRGLQSYSPARVDLAEVLIQRGDSAGAESILRDGYRHGEEDSLIPLANLLQDRGELQEAEHLLRVASAKGDSHAPYNLALLLIEENREAEGRNFLRLAADRGNKRARQRMSTEKL